MKEKITLGFVNRVDGHTLAVEYSRMGGLNFTTMVKGIPSVTNIHGIKLSKGGIYQEHPDLKDLPYPKARKIAIKRLLKKLYSFQTDEEVEIYLINELAIQGYEMKLKSSV